MVKLIICIALALVALAAANGGGGSSRGGGGPHGSSGGGGGGSRGGPGGDFRGGPGGDFRGGPGGYRGGGGKGNWTGKLCANASLAQSFVNQTQQLITNLQANASFAQALADKAQFIAYIQNSTNIALLSSNCTAFFAGLDNARNLDKQAQQQQWQYQRIADQAFWKIIQSVFGFGDSSSEGR